MSSKEQVASNVALIRDNVAQACDRAGRDPGEVTILGASKSQPLERLAWAFDAGLRVYGENRVQEALEKMPQLPPDIEWHLIGPLQSNKVNKAVPAFSVVHSVDRPKIARSLDRAATNLGKPLIGLFEVNIADEDSKHGFTPDDLRAHLEALAGLESLKIEGLMAIPPFEPDPEGSRRWFREL